MSTPSTGAARPDADHPQSAAGMAASGLDAAAWQQRLDRLSAMLTSIADHATSQARWRCPYKNRHDECTAAFGCRNQRRRPDRTRLLCAGDDKLDYRSAWDQDGAAPTPATGGSP